MTMTKMNQKKEKKKILPSKFLTPSFFPGGTKEEKKERKG